MLPTFRITQLPLFLPFPPGSNLLFPSSAIAISLMAYNPDNSVPPPPRYVMLAEQGGGHSTNLQPPPSRKNLPRYHSGRSNEKGCFGECICMFCCFIFLIILAIAGGLAYFYFVYKPQPPSYSVSNLSVGAFEFRQKELTLHTKLVVSVRAENPNEMIGIKYGDGSSIIVAYRNSTLSSGQLPSFYQGHKNVTVMQIVMEGTHPYGSGLQEAMQESSKSGNVLLDVYVHVPVSVRLDMIDLREIKVNVHCALVLDSLSPNTKPKIKSATYDGDVEF